jgi:uncharacterized membrane protein
MKGSNIAAVFRFIAGVKKTRAERQTIGIPLAYVLHFGVNLSLILIVIGLSGFLVSTRFGSPGPDPAPLPFRDLPARLAVLDLNAFVALGILLLLITPIARVLTSVILYFRKGDLVFTAITLVVLVNLLIGLLLGTA